MDTQPHNTTKARLGIVATVVIFSAVTLEVLFDTTVYLWVITVAIMITIAGLNWALSPK